MSHAAFAVDDACRVVSHRRVKTLWSDENNQPAYAPNRDVSTRWRAMASTTRQMPGLAERLALASFLAWEFWAAFHVAGPLPVD